MSAVLLVFKLNVQNVHQLQQHMIYVSTPAANHSISIARQSSARQCQSILACISDSVPASHPTRSGKFAIKPGHFLT